MPKGAINSFGGFSIPWLTQSCLKFGIYMLTHIDYPCPYPPDPGLTEYSARQSALDLLSSIRTDIRRLSTKGILKSGLYSYLLDLIEEDATIADNDV